MGEIFSSSSQLSVFPKCSTLAELDCFECEQSWWRKKEERAWLWTQAWVETLWLFVGLQGDRKQVAPLKLERAGASQAKTGSNFGEKKATTTTTPTTLSVEAAREAEKNFADKKGSSSSRRHEEGKPQKFYDPKFSTKVKNSFECWITFLAKPEILCRTWRATSRARLRGRCRRRRRRHRHRERTLNFCSRTLVTLLGQNFWRINKLKLST